MHWGTFVLSLEPIMEPRDRFKYNAEKYGFKKEDAIIFKIGQITPLNEILKLFPEPVFKYHIEDSKNLNSELDKGQNVNIYKKSWQKIWNREIFFLFLYIN